MTYAEGVQGGSCSARSTLVLDIIHHQALYLQTHSLCWELATKGHPEGEGDPVPPFEGRASKGLVGVFCHSQSAMSGYPGSLGHLIDSLVQALAKAWGGGRGENTTTPSFQVRKVIIFSGLESPENAEECICHGGVRKPAGEGVEEITSEGVLFSLPPAPQRTSPKTDCIHS